MTLSSSIFPLAKGRRGLKVAGACLKLETRLRAYNVDRTHDLQYRSTVNAHLIGHSVRNKATLCVVLSAGFSDAAATLTLWLIDLTNSKTELLYELDQSNYVQMDGKTNKNAKIMKVTHSL